MLNTIVNTKPHSASAVDSDGGRCRPRTSRSFDGGVPKILPSSRGPPSTDETSLRVGGGRLISAYCLSCLKGCGLKNIKAHWIGALLHLYKEQDQYVVLCVRTEYLNVVGSKVGDNLDKRSYKATPTH